MAVDTDHLSISIASFKDIEKLPSECFSGSTSIEVHLPLYIMEKFITNEEIMECTEEDLQNAKYRVLEFQFEMVGRTSALREFSSITGKTYKELCSAGSVLDPETLVCVEPA